MRVDVLDISSSFLTGMLSCLGFPTDGSMASTKNARILLANSKVPKIVYPTCHLGRQKSLENVRKKRYC
jgi:hypothetical protein